MNANSPSRQPVFLITLLFLCGLAVALSGCLPSTQVGPPRLYSVDEEVANVRNQAQLPDFVAYAGLSDEGKRAYRDSLMTARMYAIDLEFSNYEIELTRERQSVEAGGDLASATLSSVVPLVTGVNAKNWLAAASAMTTSGKAIYSNDILFAKTIQILQTQMEATRSHIAARIKSRFGSPVSVYPLAAALSELEDYYRAGTLTGAVSEVSSSVSIDAEQAKQEKADAIPVNLRTFSSARERLPARQTGRQFGESGGLILSNKYVASVQAALCIEQTGELDKPTLTAIGSFFAAYAGTHHFNVQPDVRTRGVTPEGKSALDRLLTFARQEPLLCNDDTLKTPKQIGGSM